MDETQPAQSRLRRRRDRQNQAGWWKVWGPLAAVVAAGFGLAITTLEPPAPTRFELAAGPRGGAYDAFAERYREILANQGYELVVRETAGSVENLRLVAEGRVALALLQGGIAEEADGSIDELRSLASLFYEPLWVFHRVELPVTQLRELVGRRIAIGAPGSGTRALALPLLEANGVDAGNTELVEITSAAAVVELEAAEVDVAFFVASPEAPYVARLLSHPEIELMPVVRSRAYRQDHPYLTRVLLGEGVVDLEQNLPDRDVPLIATNASLVASKELHGALIPLLLDTVSEVHDAAGVFGEPGSFPTADFVEFPIHREAEHYLDEGPSFLYRVLPYRTAASADRLKILLVPLITLLIPVFRAAPPLYRWRIRSRIYRWYEDLKWIDESLRDAEDPEALAELAATVRELDQEVTEVSVPLSYMDEYYRLREHIELVRRKLRRTRERDAAD